MALRADSHGEPRGAGEAQAAGGRARASTALSWHQGSDSGRFTVEGRNLNRVCAVPATPFSEGLVLVPNPVATEAPPTVTLGPIGDAEIDALSCLFESRTAEAGPASTRVAVQVLNAAHAIVAESTAVIGDGGKAAVTLRFRPDPAGVHVRVTARQEVSRAASRGIRMAYLVAYRDNELMRLCNAVGSDKGSEVYWGETYPHLYALTYDALFASWRTEGFNFLEIGLDAATYYGGQPEDAPSLRAWRAYFPNAVLYGYDLNDYGFFDQPGTRVFRGDQSSRADIARFLTEAGFPSFRVVIDDASHVSSHQQISLAALFERVEPGGLYVIEDLDWQPYEELPNTRDLLQGFIDQGTIDSPFLSDDEARALEATIDSIDIYRPNDCAFAVIAKRSDARPRR